MQRILSILAFVALVLPRANATLTFTGLDREAIVVTPEKSTGLDEIYVLYSTNGVSAVYQASSANVEWQTYGSYGGGFAETASPAVDGNSYSLAVGSDDIGYIISDGDKRYYYWIVNYSRHAASLDALEFADEQECDRARLQLQGNAAKIEYYTINGQPRELSRQLSLAYTTLAYDAESASYQTSPAEVELASIDGTFGVPAPYCDTQFTLCADRFLKQWGMEQTIVSDTYMAIAVAAETTAEQEIRDNPNEQKDDGGALGGSAPVDITFSAAVTDAAIFREWQISRHPEFEDVDDRFQQLDLSYTFRENGTFYVRFVANNAAGSCEYYSEAYTVAIGESQLLCPNAFSPGSSEGVNDEWRVSYKSIVSFECHIFNRWGQEMASFTDPGMGWDGKYKGKLVPPGAYYYVIKAIGADGRKYNLSGDINIIKSQKSTINNQSNQTQE